MSVVEDIKRRMFITPEQVDAYRDIDQHMDVRPASEYSEQVWDYMHRTDVEKGKLLPWNKTHQDIQIRPGELSLWAGKRKEGKSILTTQVILGLMQQGERAAIASMEMPIEDTLERMERQALGIEKPSRDYHDSFYSWVSGKLWMYTQGGTVQSERIIAFAQFAIHELKCHHVVIDSLMMVGFKSLKSQFEKIELQEQFVRDLAAIARDTGAHIHLIAHLRKGDGTNRQSESDDIKGGGGIPDLAGVVYIISGNRKKREEASKPTPNEDIMEKPDAWLTVEANRRGPSGSRHGLWLHGPSLQFLGRSSQTPMQMVPELQSASFGMPSAPETVKF